MEERKKGRMKDREKERKRWRKLLPLLRCKGIFGRSNPSLPLPHSSSPARSLSLALSFCETDDDQIAGDNVVRLKFIVRFQCGGGKARGKRRILYKTDALVRRRRRRHRRLLSSRSPLGQNNSAGTDRTPSFETRETGEDPRSRRLRRRRRRRRW